MTELRHLIYPTKRANGLLNVDIVVDVVGFQLIEEEKIALSQLAIVGA